MTTKPNYQSLIADKYAQIQALPDPPKDPDAMQQRRTIVNAETVLADFFSHRPDVLVSGDGYLCVEYRRGYARLVPDCIVAFGVDDPEAIEFRNGYVISEVGKPPEFVLEIASSSTGRRDVRVKRGIYAGFGVGEYWRFDRSGGKFHGAPLGGDLLVDGVYRPVELSDSDGVIWGRSPVLGLDLCWHDGRLRFYDPAAEEYLLDFSELSARADAEAAARAEAEAEVRRLREQLRRQSPP